MEKLVAYSLSLYLLYKYNTLGKGHLIRVIIDNYGSAWQLSFCSFVPPCEQRENK